MTDPRESMEADPALEDDAPEIEASDPPEAEQSETEASAVDPELEQRARILGWKPQDEWKGDPPPRGFMTAEQFVEKFANTPKEVEALKRRLEERERDFDERTKRLEAMSQRALERQRKQLEARMDRAVEEGDTEAYKAAKQEIAGLDEQVRQPQQQAEVPRETQQWMAANPWYGTDAIMTAAAKAAAIEAQQRGISDYAGQLAYVDTVISERFGGARKPQQRRSPSAVDGGGMQPPRPREKGVSDLPVEAKRAAAQLVKDGVYKSEAEYAKDYWAMERGEL